jgi:hypothetical protein
VPRPTKVRRIDRVAEWVVEFGLGTRASSDRLADERRRLTEDVLPKWAALGADESLLSCLTQVPAVGQHNDLGSWNIVVADSDFTVVDWESAAAAGLPLWDLIYFLADALVLLDGAALAEQRPAAVARLFRGDSPSSPLLFAWIRRAAETYGLPPTTIGPIATLCWLHHSLSEPARDDALALLAPGERQPSHGLEGIAKVWLTDPALGASWDRWRAA